MYWLDGGTRTIEVAKLNDTKQRLVLVHTDLDRPTDLVVDPNNGYLYWSDKGSQPRIERCRLDGSEREVVIDSSNVIEGRPTREPQGLAFDHEFEKLYFCDNYHHRIVKVRVYFIQCSCTFHTCIHDFA